MRKNRIQQFLVILLSAALLIVKLPVTIHAADALEVCFIDVGQADACIITCGSHAMIIDGGNPKDSEKLEDYLNDHEIRHLDYVVVTHDDRDHVGGLSGILDHVAAQEDADAGTIFAPDPESDASYFARFRDAADSRDLQIEIPLEGGVYDLGEAQFQILSNSDESIVLRLWREDDSFLFMGDASEDLEDDIRMSDENYTLQSSLIKIGHHGSKYSSSLEFLQAVNPYYAVITARKGDLQHPSREVLTRLRNLNEDINVLITGEEGNLYYIADDRPGIQQVDPEDKKRIISSSEDLSESPAESEEESSLAFSDNTGESLPAVSDYEEESSAADNEYEEEGQISDDDHEEEGQIEEESSAAVSENEQESPPSGSKGQKESSSENEEFRFYINKKTGIFHDSGCFCITNKDNFTGSNKKKEELISQGYKYCGHCERSAKAKK